MLRLSLKALLILLQIFTIILVCSTDTTKLKAKEFQSFCLNVHNIVRLLFGAPPLVWDKTLEERAQAWAAYLSDIQDVRHSWQSEYGDNVFSNPDPEIIHRLCMYACLTWMNDRVNYNFKNPAFSKETGRFTQMVWYNSRKIGIGEMGQAEGKFYLVGSYFPPGNILKRFKVNVLEFRKISTSCVELVSSKENFEILKKGLLKMNPGAQEDSFFYNSSEPCTLPQRKAAIIGIEDLTPAGHIQSAAGNKTGDWGNKSSTSGTARNKSSTSGNKIGTSGGKSTTSKVPHHKDTKKETQGTVIVTSDGEKSSLQNPSKILLVPIPEPAVQNVQPARPSAVSKPANQTKSALAVKPVLCFIPVFCPSNTFPEKLAQPAIPATQPETPLNKAQPETSEKTLQKNMNPAEATSNHPK